MSKHLDGDSLLRTSPPQRGADLRRRCYHAAARACKPEPTIKHNDMPAFLATVGPRIDEGPVPTTDRRELR